jgi:FkbH-like protein
VYPRSSEDGPKTQPKATSMNWLPPPADFRSEFRTIMEESDGAGRLQMLGALSQRRLDFLQTIQVGRAIKRLVTENNTGCPCLRVAVLASSTVDHLVPAITVAGLRRQLLFDTLIGPYGQYRQTLLDAASPLFQTRPDFVLLSLGARETVSGVPLAASAAEADAVVRHTIDELKSLWETARQTHGATVIQQTFLNVAEPLFGSYDLAVPGTAASVIARLNDSLREAALTENVLMLDVARQSERDGLDAWFDQARWLQGKMEIAPCMAPMYGELLARVIAAQRGLSKKCLVLDLDNTLWGGVVGDDGPEGIVLGEGSTVGEAHLALQRYAKQLRDRGIVLAVCSKNDPSIAETTFREHPEMLLRPSDISVFMANWEDKASNLPKIAERLNIGIDSLVFVDDNPAERARVRESLPLVAVPELPDDPSQYVRCVADAGYFESIAFTPDDTQRAQQYTENASREALRVSTQSLEAFLHGLKMKIVFGPFQNVDLLRVTQLIGKTNQFNLTTKRYAQHEISEFATTDGCLTLQFRLLDRFGDNGLVSAMILRPAADEPDALEVDTWVMSCRVFGRQLEIEALNIAVEEARRRGIRTIRATYAPTPRNGVVRDLYATLGFSQTDACDRFTRWRLDLDGYAPRPTSIVRDAPTTNVESQ